MRQPEGTTLRGQEQRRILDGVFLPASGSKIVPKMSVKERKVNKCKPVTKKCPLKTVALAVKI